MVYSNKFVMCVLVNGQPVKELANGTVNLPFGTEYALRFRNKNNRRAVVKIYVDGDNVSGKGYIIDSHGKIDIKRHHDVDRSFKFVDLDSGEAVEHGKNGPNHDKVKGTIEARFYLEKAQPKWQYPIQPIVQHHHHHKTEEHHHHNTWPTLQNPYQPKSDEWGHPTVTCDTGNYGATIGDAVPCSDSLGFAGPECSTGHHAQQDLRGGGPTMSSAGGQHVNKSVLRGGKVFKKKMKAKSGKISTQNLAPAPEMNLISEDALKDGCTVEGESTGQSFRSVYIDLEDNYTTLKIFMQGYEEDEVVKVQKVKKKRKKTSKKAEREALEAENDRLLTEILKKEEAEEKQRLDAAKAENEKLKKELAELED